MENEEITFSKNVVIAFLIGIFIGGAIIWLFQSSKPQCAISFNASKAADNVENMLDGGTYKYQNLIGTKTMREINQLYRSYSMRGLATQNVPRNLLENLVEQVCLGELDPSETIIRTETINVTPEKLLECVQQ